MTVPDWSELTADQQLTLLAAPNLKVTSGLELLESNFNLALSEDLTEYLIPGGGQVRWDGSATIHRTFSASLRTNLEWNRDLVRVYRVYADDKSGLTCRGNKGVFVVSAPNQDLAPSPTVWQITGQDRMAWLNQPISQSLTFAADTNVFAALQQVFFMSVGTNNVNIDPFNKNALIPTMLTYSLPTAGDAMTSASLVLPNLPGSGQQDGSGAPTWLQVITDLLALIGYQGVWCDSEGVFQCGQNLPFVNREAVFTFNAGVPNVVAQPRSLTRTPPTFNVWRFLNSTLPDTVDPTSGAVTPTVPTIGNGIAIRENADQGPSSIASMFNMRFATTVTLAAGTQEVLEAQADAYMATAIRSVETATVTTRAFPGASHFDVFRWVDSRLDDSPWTAAATTWVEPLDGGSTQWTWTKVGDG